ncbi:MAG: YceI family protein [Patescibacteria group bacterium]|jgi:polyisoprenoid-binding protein YceI|nr:YceI family protein [Patescibacteria group bacterium]
MKKIYLGLFLFLGFFLLSACTKTNVQAPTTDNKQVNNDIDFQDEEPVEGGTNFKVNAPASVVKWSAQKTIVRTSDHFGTINVEEGRILMDGDEFIGGNITIDMKSLKDLDIPGEKSRNSLETHIKSEDFFDVEKYPEAKFVIKDIEEIEDDEYNYQITGDLTIKGLTNEIDTQVKLDKNEDMINAEASFSIDRTKWEIIYGSGNFFKELGDNVIDDMIGFDLRIVAETI